MALSRIVLRLARNPGTEFANGDDHRGYSVVAPLTQDHHIDSEAFSHDRAKCQVRRFAPDEDAAVGRLVHRSGRWAFDYGEEEALGDEAVFRLGEHRFEVGEYVTVEDEGGRLLTYKVTDVEPA